MRVRQLFTSLRFKVTVGVLLALLIILSALAYVRHWTYQRLLVESLHATAENAGETIETTLQHAMFTHDRSMLSRIVNEMGRRPDVRNVFLLNKPGEVIISTAPDTVGQTFDIEDETCQACHRYEAVSRNENVVLELEQGNVFRNVNAIENAVECIGCHNSSEPFLGVLISDFDLTSIEQSLAVDSRRNLLWSVGATALVLGAVHVLMSKMVIGRLEHLVGVIKRVGVGDLDARAFDSGRDEIGELVHAFNQMTDGLKEKERLEQSLKEQTKQLQMQASKLSALNAIAETVNQSLDLQEFLDSALDKVLELMNLRASWIVLRRDRSEEFSLAAYRGLPEQVALTHVQQAWPQCVCSDVLTLGQAKVFQGLSGRACPLATYFEKEGLVFRACVPLTSRERVLGVMSLLGDTADGSQAFGDDALDTLTSVGRQIGIGVEKVSLYEELRREEMRRRHLLERVMTVQEEERKRIALELHDQTGQPLTSLIMTLGMLSEANSLDEAKARVHELRAVVSQILQEVHDLALELRPSVLDDLGLLAALRHLHKEFQDRFRLPVDLQVLSLDGKRLPSDVETALYRIVQEALTNVARHAHASGVSVLLERRGGVVKLIVEDDGAGFDVPSLAPLGQLGERLGLYGMQERAALLGGTFTIESTPGTGTAIYVEVPLQSDWSQNEQDTSVGC